MSEEITGAEHSLKASIDLDFTAASNSAFVLQTHIEDIADAFQQISRSANKVNNTTGERLKELLNSLQSAQTIEVTDVTKIREKIENAIVRSIVEGGVNIKGLEGGLAIDFQANDLEAINTKLGNAITKMIRSKNGMTFKDFDIGAVTLYPAAIKGLKEQLSLSLIKHMDTLNFDFKSKVTKEPIKFKLDITPEHMQQMLDAIRDKIMIHLSDPNNLVVDTAWNMKPIQIKTDDLRKVYEELAASVQQMAKSVTVDQELDKIMSLDLNTDAFSAKLKQFVAQVQVVQTALKNVSLKADENDLREFVTNMKALKGDLVRSLETFLGSVHKQLQSVNHPSVPDLQSQVNNMQSVANSLVISLLNGPIESIMSQMKSGKKTSVYDPAVLAGISEALTLYIQRVADSLAEFVNSSKVDEKKLKEAAALLDGVLNLRIARILDALKSGDTAPSVDYGALIRELNQEITSKIVRVISEIEGMGNLNIDFNRVIDEFNRVIGTKITDALEVLREANVGTSSTDLSKLIHEIDSGVNNLVVGRLSHMAEALRTTKGTGGEFSAKISALNKDVVKLIAEQMQTTVSELRKQKVLTGNDALTNLAEANLQAVFNKFHDIINEKATEQVSMYKTALEKVPFVPDLSTVPYLIRKFEELQVDVTTKVKELLDQQFHAMAVAIKEIQAKPMSIGTPAVPKMKSAPMAAPVGRVSSGAAGVTGSDRYVRSQNANATSRSYNYAPYNEFERTFGSQRYQNPGGDTQSFMGSVRNTLRYILAGSLMGVPTSLVYQGWDANKEFDYQMQKARVNVDAKNFGSDTSTYPTAAIRKDVLDMAIAQSVDVKDAAKAYQSATMKFDKPYEALTVARSATRIKAIEGDIDVQDATKGLTAMAAQWNLSSKAVDEVTNMMILAANTKFTTIGNLLETQKRAGSIFAENLPGMSKRTQLATSIGLSALYNETTGRSGEQGGTFWKNVLTNSLSGEGLKYFEDISQSNDPVLKALNPYKEHKNAKGEVIKGAEQKNGLDMMFALTDAMNSNLEPRKKKEILKKWANQWHIGDMEAMIKSFETDAKNLGGNKVVQSYGGVKEFFKTMGATFDEDTANMTPEEKEKALKTQTEALAKAVELMHATMQDTYTFRTQRLKSEFQATSVDVFDSLKDEFGAVAGNLSLLLRLLRDNANEIAEVVTLVGKVATVMGIKYAAQWMVNKRKDGKENERQKNLAYNYDRYRYFLNEEGRATNLNRMIVADRMADKQAELDRINQKRGLIGQEQNHAALTTHKENISSLEKQIRDLNDEQIRLETPDKDGKTQHGSERHKKVIDLQTDLDLKRQDLIKQKSNIERKIAIGGKIDPRLEADAAKLEKELRGLERRFKEVDKQAMSVNHRMNELDKSAQDYGLEMNRLNNVMHRVDMSQQGLSAGSVGLKQRLSMMGYEARLGSKAFELLVSDVDKLNDEFAQGKIQADAYFKSIRQLERKYAQGNTPIMNKASWEKHGKLVPVNGLGPAQSALFGEELLGAVMSYGALKGLGSKKGGLDPMEQPPQKPNVFKRMGQWAKGYYTGETAVEVMGDSQDVDIDAQSKKAPKKGVVRGVGRVGGAVGKGALRGASAVGKGLGRMALRSVPYVGTAIVGFDVMNDGVSSIFKTQNERDLKRAENLKGISQLAEMGANNSTWGKIFGSLGLAVSSMTDIPMSLIKGTTSPGFTDYAKAFGAMWEGKDGTEVNKILDQRLQFTKKQAEAQAEIERERLKQQEAKDLSTAGLDGRADHVNWDNVTTFEEGKQMMAKIRSDADQKVTESEAKHQLKIANDTIRGIEQDSAEMRALMLAFYDENIKVLQEAIDAAEKRRDAHPIGSDAWKGANSEIQNIQLQQTGYKVDKYRTETSAFDGYVNDLQYNTSMSDAGFGIQRAKLEQAGVPEDSLAIRAVEKSRLLAENKLLTDTRGKLSQLLEDYKGNAEQTKKIQQQILNIDLKQNENLVAIKKAVQNEKSTFNLPEGVAPMTYWESKVKDGTHQSVSFGYGETNVNIMIDKMTGDEADLQRMGEEINKALRKDRATTASRELASQVRTGIQNNHRG